MSLCLIVKNTAQTVLRWTKTTKKTSSADTNTGRKPKHLWHSSTVSFEPVSMIFINTRVTAKSSECLCRESTGRASIPYSIEDIHFTFSMSVPFFEGQPPRIWEGQKTSKFRRDFWQLSTLIANISTMDLHIERLKKIWSTTTPSTLDERNFVNFGPQTKKF